MTNPWGGKSKIENNLMGVEYALGAEFVKMHSPRIETEIFWAWKFGSTVGNQEQ